MKKVYIIIAILASLLLAAMLTGIGYGMNRIPAPKVVYKEIPTVAPTPTPTPTPVPEPDYEPEVVYINPWWEPENIEELKSTIVEYQKNNEDPTLDGFLAEISLYTDLDRMKGDENCVTLMTVHSAKGLEFENVYVIGMEDGIFPGSRCFYNDADMEEEPEYDTEEAEEELAEQITEAIDNDDKDTEELDIGRTIFDSMMQNTGTCTSRNRAAARR